MGTTQAIDEFRTAWLPHVTDSGLARVGSLLAAASPLLIHGAFTKAMPMGCLASHIGWHHPLTANWDDQAGVRWLAKVARLNPATSRLVLRWDRGGVHDLELRHALLDACAAEGRLRGATC